MEWNVSKSAADAQCSPISCKAQTDVSSLQPLTFDSEHCRVWGHRWSKLAKGFLGRAGSGHGELNNHDAFGF